MEKSFDELTYFFSQSIFSSLAEYEICVYRNFMYDYWLQMERGEDPVKPKFMTVIDLSLVKDEKGEPVTVRDFTYKIFDKRCVKNSISISALPKEENSENVSDAVNYGPRPNYVCRICGDQFAKERVFRRHILIHNAERHLSVHANCSQCYAFKLSEDVSDRIQCNICGEVFQDNLLLKKHWNFHVEVSVGCYNKINNLLECYECKAVFRNKRTLTSHCKKHRFPKNRLLMCDYCQETFLHKNVLRKHILVHLNLKPFVCYFCDRAFNQKVNVEKHMWLHLDIKPFSCPKCCRRFRQKVNMIVHMRTHGPKLFQVRCKECSELIQGFRNYVKHRQMHVKKKQFVCHVCKDKFEDPDELLVHCRNTHALSKEHRCSFCGKNFAGPKHLKIHEKLHNANNYVKCYNCEKMFGSKANLTRHIRSVHLNLTFDCDVCFKSFKSQTNFVIHKKLHTSGKPHSCQICSKTFSKASVRNFHQKQHRELRKLCICDVCNTTTLSVAKMREHMIKVHFPEDYFTCGTCGRKFKSKWNMQKHCKTHTDEKRYSCLCCEKKFKEPFHLKAHETLHKEIKKFACRYCPKRFNQNGNLKRHEITHLHRKPYFCETCDRKYYRLGNALKHKCEFQIVEKEEEVT